MASTRLLAALFSMFVIALGVAACGSDETTTVTETASTAAGDQAAATETGTGEAADEEIAAPDAKAQNDIDKITAGLADEQQQSGASADDPAVEGNGVETLTFKAAMSGLSHARYCASNVVAGPNTSCAFALNVAYDYFSLGRPRSFRSYSPTTGQYYNVYCRYRHPTICRAGNNALIAIA
ncbi:MAG: hypothetical protein ACHQJ5_00620 [Vicinamibacteria bacterium]|jgi:hypothetical protein